MRANLVRVFSVAMLTIVVLAQSMPEAQSRQRKRTSRRATSPARTQPAPTPATSDEPSVVSTADEAQTEAAPTRTTARTRRDATQAENEKLHGTVRELSTQVDKLSGELNSMKTEQRAMFDLERLTRAEQRAEALRTQLREVTDKEFQYQERLAEIEYELRPDSIQRRAALIGSLNPSAVRDAIQQQYERERARIQKQLELVATSRARLEAAVATADAEVDRLRQRVEAADQQQANSPTGATTTTTSTTTATPQPTPTPAEPPKE